MTRTRPRARALLGGVAIVIALTSIATTALAALVFTTSPAVSHLVPPGTPDHVVFAFRNTDPMAVTITGTANTGGEGCPAQTLAPLDPNIMLPHTLATGEMMQFEATTVGYTTAGSGSSVSALPRPDAPITHDCMWLLLYSEVGGGFGGSGYGSAGETVEFQIALTMPDQVDLQPMAMDFGDQSTFEDQVVLLTNLSTGTIGNVGAEIDGDGSHSIVFEAPAACTGLTTCNLPGVNVAAQGVLPFTVRCAPEVLGAITATINFSEIAEDNLGSVAVTCNGLTQSGLEISPKQIDVFNGQTAIATVAATGNGTTQLVSAMITDAHDEFAFTATPGCTDATCAFSGSDAALPAMLTIGCTPQTAMTTGTLTVTGTNASDHDDAVVTCYPAGVAPAISVSPTSLDVGAAVAIGAASAPQPITISNTGTALLGHIRVTTPSTEWSADACVASDCALAPGKSQIVNVTFAPNSSGPHASYFLVASNDPVNPAIYVAVSASGDGDDSATNARIVDLYACDGAPPTRGWPLVLAIAFVLRPRRRR